MVVCINMYNFVFQTQNYTYLCTQPLFRRLSLHARSGMIVLVFAFQYKNHRYESTNPEGTFLFQYLPEKKSKQKELERKSKQ